MAVIYYRFKSQRRDQISNIRFDGTGLTAFELKREIIYANKLLTATDVDILLYHSEEGEKEYEDDNEVIPRASTVLVRRTSAGKKGHGNVGRYIAGRQRLVRPVAMPTITAAPSLAVGTGAGAGGSAGEGASEEDMIKQMFSQQDQQWDQQQQVMATATRIETNRTKAKLDENIPEYYICYKCGAKGKHHIRNCPKNNDPNWEGVRVKKTTGIPKSHLKAVDTPSGVVNDPTQNYMVDEEGKYVVAVADKRAWERYQKIQASKNESNLDSEEVDVEDPALRDPVTQKLLKDPVRTKCCRALYSRHTIENLLIESDFKCPNCGKEGVYLDSLEPDKEAAEKVKKFLEERKKKEGEEPNSKRQKVDPAGLPALPKGPAGMAAPPAPVGMPFMPQF